MSKCYIDYMGKNGSTLKQTEIDQLANNIKDELQQAGQPFDPEQIAAKVTERLASQQKQATIKFMQRLSSHNILAERGAEIERMTKGLSQKKRLQKIVSMIFDTGDTFNFNPLEKLIKSEGKLRPADFFNRVRNIVDEDGIGYLKKDAEQADVMTEYNQFFKNIDAVSITGNGKAYKVAKELFDTELRMVEMRKANGHIRLLSDMRLQPKWNHRMIADTNKNDFVQQIANALDDEVHGDLVRRQQLASELYDNMSKPEARWREQGDKNPVNLQADNWVPDDMRKPTFAFKKGEDLQKIVADYSDYDLMQQLQLQFNEFGRETALIQFFGADYKNAYKTFINKYMKANYKDAGEFARQEAKAAEYYITNFVEPEHLEHNLGASVMTGIRGFQASTKLGGATITAMMDVPNFMYSAKVLYGLDTKDAMSVLFNYGYKGARKDYADYAEYMLEGVDTYLGNMADRFGHIGTGAGGKFEEGGSMMANTVFKFSGLNWWTEGRKAVATGILGKELGKNIKNQIAFDKLNPTYRQALEKYGINKKEWTTLLKDKPLRQGATEKIDMLDIHAVREQEWEFSYGKSSLKQKLSAYFNDAVDTMVMTPGDYDIAIGSLFLDPQSYGSQLVKTLLQFKSHPIAYTRKVLVRSMKQSKSGYELATNMTILGAEMMLMGLVVVQIKDFLKGKQPRRYDDGNLWIRAAEVSGAFGLISDTALQFGGSQWLSRLTDEPSNSYMADRDKASQLLGPFFGDFIKITSFPDNTYASFEKNGFAGMVSRNTQEILNFVPGQNLWWLAMFRRALTHEYMKKRLEPTSYYRQENKANKIARDNMIGGKSKNFVFETLIGD